MPSQKNLDEVKSLESAIADSSAVYLADYAGLSVNDQVELRAKVREAGGELKIAKNRLLSIAMKNRGLNPDDLGDNLTGPNITLFAGEDAVAPLKALVEFAKDHEKPSVKIGLLGQELLSMEKLTQLAKLPSKAELIARLIGQIQAPVRGIVNVLSAPSRNLVYALSAIKDLPAGRQGNKQTTN